MGELAVLQLLTRNAYTPTTSTQSSVGPVIYSPTGYDDPGQHDSRLFGWGYGTVGGVVDEIRHQNPATHRCNEGLLLQLLHARFVRTLKYKVVKVTANVMLNIN